MSPPFLIIGYERSGSTLLRRIVSMNPFLEYDLVHEKKKLLLKCKTQDEAIAKLTFLSKQAGKEIGGISSIVSGQKIPYLTFKENVNVMSHFIGLFPSTSIIPIIRDPLEVVMSQHRTFGKDIKKCAKRYFDNVPKVINYLKNIELDIYNINYLDLVSNPEKTIFNLYSWMGMELDKKYIKKVISIKDPWEYNGRVMCGLRYFDSVKKIHKKIDRKVIIAVQDILRQINKKDRE